MDDFRKAAILLKHLTPREREEVLERFDHDQRKRLELLLADAADVSRAELVGIVSEYQSWLQKIVPNTGVIPDQHDLCQSSVDSSTGTDRLWEPVSNDVATLTARLAREPATVLSAVMCHLREETARELYESLPEDRRAALCARLPAQGELMPLVKQELARILNEPAADHSRDNRPGDLLLARLIGS